MQFPIVPPTTSRESLVALPTWWCGLSLGVSFQHPLGFTTWYEYDVTGVLYLDHSVDVAGFDGSGGLKPSSVRQ